MIYIKYSKYDYLIVGAGLFGSVFAHEMTKQGKKCLVIEKRNHIGGNVYDKEILGINVHLYGSHIFHTNNKRIWNYINQFGEFNNFINSPIAKSKGKIYNLPFNMNTFYQIWGIDNPNDVFLKIKSQNEGIDVPNNLEEQSIKLVGKDIYELLIKEYTEKQWGKKCNELPCSIINRLPLRFTFDNNYFNAKYQGIPFNGYNDIFNKLLNGIEVILNIDFLDYKDYFESIADNIIFTGGIDSYFNYCYGKLEYRSLKFEHEFKNMPNYQGNAVINYIDKDVPFTRIIEHKHFNYVDTDYSIITKEYPVKTNDAFYPINDEKNNKLYEKYRKLCNDNVYFCGRLGSYQYIDMDKTILNSLNLVNKLLK